MRYIFSVLFIVLFGSSSLGGVGDVYYCETTNLSLVSDHKTLRSKGEKFRFKWNQSQIKFGEHGYLQNTTLEMVFSSDEMFHAIENDKYEIATFQRGAFSYTNMGYGLIISLVANCDKF